jgi:hypothetical protein
MVLIDMFLCYFIWLTSLDVLLLHIQIWCKYSYAIEPEVIVKYSPHWNTFQTEVADLKEINVLYHVLLFHISTVFDKTDRAQSELHVKKRLFQTCNTDQTAFNTETHSQISSKSIQKFQK